VPALIKVTVVPETVHTPVVADVTATVKPELAEGETVKVPLPNTFVPGFVNVIDWGSLLDHVGDKALNPTAPLLVTDLFKPELSVVRLPLDSNFRSNFVLFVGVKGAVSPVSVLDSPYFEVPLMK
jgi:hypothetical protein